MIEGTRSNAEMLELVHRRASVIRKTRRRRVALTIQSLVAIALVIGVVTVLRRPDGHSVVVPGPSSSPRSSPESSPVETRPPTLPPTAAATTPDSTPEPTGPPAAQRVVEPVGTNGGLYGLRLSQTAVVSTPLTGVAGQTVLHYTLQVEIDTGGRGGTITSDATTDDGQLRASLDCKQSGCTFAAGGVQRITTDVTVTTAGAVVSGESHNLPMSLNFDDGTALPFGVKFVVNPLAGDVVLRQINDSTGPPAEVQRVVGVGGFAYHLISAFHSLWIVGKNSETLTRLDASTGQIEASIRLSAGQTNRVTATDTAVYVSGNPVTRIDPTDNSTTTIELPAHSLGIIGDHEQVWAAGRDGVERIDADGTVTGLGVPDDNWIDLAIANGLVWVVSQDEEIGRVVAFDGQTGDVRYDIPVVAGQPNSAPVRLVADERSVVVGIDTSGLGGRTGEVVVIDPSTGSITARVPLDSRPEGIALTDRHIWTSAAVLDRATLAVSPVVLGFTIAFGPDGSIWGTRSSLDGTGIDIGKAIRYAPGDFAG